MLFQNTHDKKVLVLLHIGNQKGFWLNAGDTVDVPADLANPDRASNGARLPSLVEMACPALEPVDEDEKAVWLQAPSATKKDRKANEIPTVEDLMKTGLPKGLAIVAVEAVIAKQQENLNRVKAEHETEREAELIKAKAKKAK